jgi:ketosteroid isomerase-like protein
MSQKNVEVVKRLFDAAPDLQQVLRGGGDLGQHPWLSLWHPECTLEELAEVPDPASYRGRAGVVAFFRRGFDEVWDEWEFVPQEMTDGPKGVLVVVANRGRSRSGVEVNMQIFQTFLIRDGMVFHAAGYLDRTEALKAVGLEE